MARTGPKSRKAEASDERERARRASTQTDGADQAAADLENAAARGPVRGTQGRRRTANGKTETKADSQEQRRDDELDEDEDEETQVDDDEAFWKHIVWAAYRSRKRREREE